MECTSEPGCDSSSSRSVCAGRRGGPWAGPLWGCDSCLVRHFATWSAHATERPGPAVPHPAAVPPHHMEPWTSHSNGEEQRRRRWTVFLSAIWPPLPPAQHQQLLTNTRDEGDGKSCCLLRSASNLPRKIMPRQKGLFCVYVWLAL